jgi:hypothetical protein
MVDPVVAVQQAKLEASDGAMGDVFGISVSFFSFSGTGNQALAGAWTGDTTRGSVRLAFDTAMPGIVGAWRGDTTRGRDVGSAYVFGLGQYNGGPYSTNSDCASRY